MVGLGVPPTKAEGLVGGGLSGPIFFADPSRRSQPRKKGFPLQSLTRGALPIEIFA